MSLVHLLWLAWGEDGWREDPDAVIARFPILNALSDAIGLIEYAERKAERYPVPDWRRPWFGAAVARIEAAWAVRMGAA